MKGTLGSVLWVAVLSSVRSGRLWRNRNPGCRSSLRRRRWAAWSGTAAVRRGQSSRTDHATEVGINPQATRVL